MEYEILVSGKKQEHLVEWLRFIQDHRPTKKSHKGDTLIVDLRNASFMHANHFTSLACLIEEFHTKGAGLKFKYKDKSAVGKFIKYTKFDKYWNRNFNRNNCFLQLRKNVLPVWHLQQERIDSFAKLAESFYTNHCLPGKDLTALRLTVVEALNNICDHSESKNTGFIFTQYIKNQNQIVVSICDFGIGIPNKINAYLRKQNLKELSHEDALTKALELHFTTKSQPNNAGKGFDNILSQVKTTNGEIQIVTNRAFYSNKIKDSRQLSTIMDGLKLHFNGTTIIISLDTKHFLKLEAEVHEEMGLL